MRTRNIRNRRKYIHQLLGLAALTIVLTVVIALFGNGFKSRSSASTEVQTYKYYTSIEIQSGDTLTKIAQEHMEYYPGTLKDYINEVKYMNAMSNDTIYSGTYLYIPYYSTELL